jgi:hypothetical protein
MGSPNAAPSLVANAPAAPDSNRYETSRPVTGSHESERSRSDSGSGRRGAQVDISV